ncbi:MAG: hypothetical protein BWK80_43080 [Desulfobacteraceae bacterium IS3]|nr:MAG: hypothetical protein BWK80_43080 [Desulfobacteraceae bacterium IS3]
MTKRYFTLVNMLLVAAMSYFAVQIGYQFMMTRLNSETVLTSGAKPGDATESELRQPAAHYDAFTNRDLFKTKAAQDALAAAAMAKEKAPEPPPTMELTKLQVRLWGTVAGEGIASYAVIEDLKDKKQSLYHINDEIQKAKVKQILREKVILTLGGKDEVLEMGEKAGQPPNKPIFPPAPVGAVPMLSDNVRLARTEIEEAMNDVNNLMKQARIRPHFTNGKPDGLTLTGVRPDSIFTKLGLQSGDILTGVDGKDIQSVDDALKLYQSLKSSPGVSLQIRRQGETKNIGYSIE